MKFPLSKPSTPEFIKENHQCRRSSYAGRGSPFLGNSESSIKSKRRFSLSFDNNVVDNLDSKQEKSRRVFSFFHKRKRKDNDSSFQSQQQTKQAHVKNYEQSLELHSPRKRLDNDELMIEAVLRNYPKEKCHSLLDHKKLALQELIINVTNTSPSDLQKLKVKLIQKLQDSLHQQSSEKEEEEEEEEDSSVADSDIMIDDNECHSSDTETEITHPLSSRSFLLESAPTSMQSLLSTTTTAVSYEKNTDPIESTRLITVTNLPIIDEYGMKEGNYRAEYSAETAE